MKNLLILLFVVAPVWAQDTCTDCHSALPEAYSAAVQLYEDDVHRERGFGCVDCHGGDAAEMDPELSMSPSRGFRGSITRDRVPEFCARCHSDAEMIHNFDPQQRIDQLAQYETSVHGKRLKLGDTSVANCVDCHGVHNIREVDHPLSPVHPLNLPETCSRCHSDGEHMAEYGLGTEQFEQYRRSVHWQALSQRGDLSAPSCASCHGNHGATPPQASSVSAVCGTCHVLLERLYNESPHQPVFEAMEMAGCVTCHGNHEITHPTTALLAGDDAVCGRCHEADSAGGSAAAEMGSMIQQLAAELDKSEEILGTARQSGMEVSEALLRLTEGRESLVKARVAVHAFQPDAVEEPVNSGMKVAEETFAAGEEALRERRDRRIGLGLALISILATMAGLWLAIRVIENKPDPAYTTIEGEE